MRRFASASAALAAAIVALAAGGASATSQACANSTPPTILPEPAYTLGATNVIRWERVANSCWDNEGADGKESTERKFDIVVTNVANGLSEWTSVSGQNETDTTISGSEFPHTSQTGIEGRRFTYKVRRRELVCNSGNEQTGVCFGRTYKFSPFSATVESTQDSTPPSGSLQLSFGQDFTRNLSVPAVVGGSGAPAWMQLSNDPAFPCGEGRRAVPCVSPYSNGTQVQLAPGPDGERQVFARLWDDARRPDGDPGAIVFGLPPGNVSTVFRDTIVVDTTGPAFIVRASTTQIVVGGTVSFEMVNPVDGVGTAAAGVDAAQARWTFGDGTTGSGLATTHAFAAVGSYDVTARLLDRIANATVSPPLRITVTAAPVPPTPGTTPANPGPPAPDTADRTAPSLAGLAVTKRRGMPTRLAFRASERATLLVQIRRLTPRPARLVAGFRKSVRAGRGGFALPRAVRRAGRYRITIAARDAAGNVSAPRVLTVRSAPR